MRHILLTGASGFLGQHFLYQLLKNKNDDLHVYALHQSKPELSQALAGEHRCTVVQLDLCDESAVRTWFDTALSSITIDCCIHTAALSSPKACNENPQRAQAINVPKNFLSSLFKTSPRCRIVLLSSDQVYDGTKEQGSFYDEDKDAPNPCNIYGSTKLALEQYAIDNLTNSSVILRSSIILGPPAPYAPSHGTFLDFCASRAGKSTTYWTNEIRSVVSVTDVCTILCELSSIKNVSVASDPSVVGVYNMGGPDPVSRYDMAVAVQEHCPNDGDEAGCVVAAVKEDANGSPLNIAMDSSKLRSVFSNLPPFKTLKEMVAHTLGKE